MKRTLQSSYGLNVRQTLKVAEGNFCKPIRKRDLPTRSK